MKQSQAGQTDAFERLVRRFQEMAIGYSYSLLGDYSLAEDVAQDAFLTAYLCLSQLRNPAAFPGWFRRIVFKQADRVVRRKQLATVGLENASRQISDQPELVEVFVQNEVRRAIDEAVASLPSHEHTIFVRFYFYQQSYKTISSALDLPVSTVKSRLYSARKRIKEHIMSFTFW
ncbi:sigma-70 family RNA polymerase sigma factor [Chloroflexi bacterium TSY]|nr:sigma-70 family RNA polymerase sigma factor [Chloroflexi bacterium TSY]